MQYCYNIEVSLKSLNNDFRNFKETDKHGTVNSFNFIKQRFEKCRLKKWGDFYIENIQRTLKRTHQPNLKTQRNHLFWRLKLVKP